MPPKAKAGPSKADKAQSAKIAEDKTFGMKNKNKSKVVQKYIKSIHNNVQGAPRGGVEQAERDKRDKKEADLKKAALMASLFNQQTDKKGRAYDPAAKKSAKQAEEDAVASGKKLDDAKRKAVIEGVANTIRLTNPKGVRMSEIGGHAIIGALKDKHPDAFKFLSLLLFIKANDKVFWVDDPESSNPMIRCQEDVDAEVAPDERSLEEILQEKLAALPPGGTPVTPETFKAWKQRREAERSAREEEERKELTKKTKAGGTGLSGKDLFTYDASLFVDDADAAGDDVFKDRVDGPMSDDEEPRNDDASDDGEEDVEESGAAENGAEDRDANAASSSGGVAINASLFLGEGADDLPDDLDDLDDSD